MTLQIKSRPILFSAEMVRAILDSRKTQTRRVIKPQPPTWVRWLERGDFGGIPYYGSQVERDARGQEFDFRVHLSDCPYGKPGDTLWVRETFMLESNFGVDNESNYPPSFNDGRPIRWDSDEEYGKHWTLPHYRATDAKPYLLDNDDNEIGWKPSIHMPRWASRIILEIVNVRFERVQDIHAVDALAEGVTQTKFWTPQEVDDMPFEEKMWDDHHFWATYPQIAFARLWDSINAKRGYGWSTNPYVWVIEFKRTRP